MKKAEYSRYYFFIAGGNFDGREGNNERVHEK
jgi:hypothetical protein